MITVLLVIAILVLLIVVHELGHFIAAKLSGVKVEEFGVGYPPRAFSFGRWGGTEYTLNWIPFGGFVRLFGDGGEPRHGRGSLMDASQWKQALILFAGVAMNAVAAWALFTIAFHVGVPQPVQEARPGEAGRVIVADVVPGSPASSAGLSPGDQILDITDEKGTRIIDNFVPEAIVAFVRDHAGQSIFITYVSEGVQEEATLIPVQGILSGEAGRPAIGTALVLVSNRSEPWAAAAKDGLSATLRSFNDVAGTLWGMLAGAARGSGDLSQVVGPVGIVGYVGSASQNGIGAVLMLAASISVNLAIINLIPVPALDGGRLLALGIEAAIRRKLPRVGLQVLNTLGIALIVLLMLVVTYNDIGRLLT